MRFAVYEIRFDFRTPLNPPGSYESEKISMAVPAFVSESQIRDRARKVALACAKKRGASGAVITDIKRVKTTAEDGSQS